MTIDNPLADNSPDHEDQNLVLRARNYDQMWLPLNAGSLSAFYRHASVLQKLASAPGSFNCQTSLNHIGRCSPCLDELRELRRAALARLGRTNRR